MAFAPTEESRQKARPVTLYQFILGDVAGFDPGPGWTRCDLPSEACMAAHGPPNNYSAMPGSVCATSIDCAYMYIHGTVPISTPITATGPLYMSVYNRDEPSLEGGIGWHIGDYLYLGTDVPGPFNPTRYAYTDAEQQLTVDSVIYQPIPIARDAIVSSGTLDRSKLTIRMPRDVEISELFRVWPPPNVMTLIIRQGHLLDDGSPDEFLVCWSGRVLSLGREGDECVISGEPVSSSLRRPGLRRNYQLGCPHVLYGDECKANRAASTVTSTVASKSGTSITVGSGWNGSFPADKFREGIVEWTNDDGGTEKRKILSVSGNTLALSGLLRDLDVGDAVNIILGCNHQMDDCEFLFNNIQNHGGCPWIPTKNPVGYRNNYY